MAKKTIMHITGTMHFGGAEVLMMNIIRKLHDKFNFVFLINQAERDKGNFDDEILSLGVKIMYCKDIRSLGVKKYQKELIEILKEVKPDVVHCHLNARCGVIAKSAHMAGIKKIISHSHAKLKFKGNPIKSLLSYAELYWQKTMINKYSTDFWGCSEEALPSLYYKKNIKGGKCRVVSNLIDAERFIYPSENAVKEYKEKYNPNGKFALGVVGRIAPVKNYLFAVEVANELKNRGKDFVLFIAGLKQNKEYTEKLFDKITALGLDEYVKYVEPRSDVENCYAMMDVVLGTSIREGFSLTAVEAQLSGAYTLLSNGYPREVNLGAGNCEHVDEFKPSIWADKIVSVMEPPVFVSEKARKDALVNRGFDLTEEVEKIAKEYEKE